MNRLICIFLLSFASFYAEEKLSLDSVEALVKKNMSELKAAELRVNQARNQKEVSLAEYDFQVTGSASADRLFASRNNSTNFSPFADKRYGAALTVSKTLYSFGRNKATERLGFAQILESEIQKKALYRDLVFRARLNYWEVLFQDASKDLAVDLEDLRLKEQSDAEGLFEAGVSSKVDVLQSQVNRLAAKDSVESSSLAFQQSQRNFASSVGEVEKSFVLAEKLTLPTDLEGLLKLTKETISDSLEVDALIASNKSSEARIDELEARQKPELSANASAGWAADEADELGDAYQGGLAISWNIFSGHRFKRQQLVEKDSISANEMTVLTEIRERKRQLFRLQDEAKILKVRLANEEKAVALAKENYEIAREQYRAGLLTLTQVSDVNFQWIQSQFRYITLVYESQLLRENLLYLNWKEK